MAEETKKCENKYWMKRHGRGGAGGGAVYGLGLIGALIYFLQSANTFWMVVMGILKSIVWPAMMVYHLFGFLRI